MNRTGQMPRQRQPERRAERGHEQHETGEIGHKPGRQKERAGEQQANPIEHLRHGNPSGFQYRSRPTKRRHSLVAEQRRAHDRRPDHDAKGRPKPG